MLNGNTLFELGSLAFWQTYQVYSAEQQSRVEGRAVVMAEAPVQPAAQKSSSLFAPRTWGNLASSYQTSPAGAK